MGKEGNDRTKPQHFTVITAELTHQTRSGHSVNPFQEINVHCLRYAWPRSARSPRLVGAAAGFSDFAPTTTIKTIKVMNGEYHSPLFI